MKSLTLLFRFALLLSLPCFGSAASADVIDPYTASQGPFTVGPGEAISDEDAADASECSDERAGIVATIRSMRSGGSSFETIARHLNAQGVPTFSGKGEWRAQNVSRAYNSACNEG